MRYVLQRLREPSTLAGIAALLSIFGVPAGVSEGVVEVIGGAAAIGAVLMPG